ncbi:HipA domain-containing protein [Rathayibacter rathayi]|uniref:HipA domain-containing protein n=1 Tax=Rathayibacter rathayi TaxID=33887 RepID=UPI000CE80C50|nr:HipA domain-containing protein [Rathayibacter rathayi]PPF26079.1 hypothetical protein C5C34_01220 [Rathayibacter rathayi]PPG88644.1 hypothetical protein C5C47_06840 [Rathayibacter rathayi]PPG97205.1 hypothetical protein C5C00_07370 [Rathayibacter rathayi]
MAKRSLLSCPVVRDAVLVLGQLVREARVARRWTRNGRTGEKEQRARYVTSPDVLAVLRRHGPTRADPSPELFARIAFAKAIRNSDDHDRNHAAFWDGHHLSLIPAYDLAPGNRSGETASQALGYGRSGERRVHAAALLPTAPVCGLDLREGRAVVERILGAVLDGFDDAVEQARVPERDRSRLPGHLVLNPGVPHDLTGVVTGWTGGVGPASRTTRRADPRQGARSASAEGRVQE